MEFFTMTSLLVSNIALWVVVIALCLVVLALARQVGVLHDRIAPAGALMLAKGLKVGEAAPRVTVADLAGGEHEVAAPRADKKSTLLMFVSPTCPVCKELLPVLKSSRRNAHRDLEIFLASDGEMDKQREFVAAHNLQDFCYLVSAPLGLAYQVSRLPYAVLLDAEGVLRARGIVNSREHLESLFEAQRLGVASLQEYLENRPGRAA
jgi:methylamine dehydrogenase accessory protein MauD